MGRRRAGDLRRGLGLVVTWWAAPALAGAAYYLLVLIGAVRWRRSPTCVAPAGGPATPVSILKPIRGRDPRFFEAIRSHAAQDYPQFEILFGFSDPKDPAAGDIARLQAEFPRIPISAHVVSTTAPNTKVGVLADLARRARYPVLLVNDSDIVVEPGYLRAVMAPLLDKKVGLVTCLYRAAAQSWPSRAEALGIATEFAPSVIVARLLGVAEFALGSTMVFRAESLRAIGGFEALQEYLADDYQLGRQLTETLHLRIEFAPVVVETDLGAQSWAEVWRHQLRWSRTIRVSRRSGYYGYAVTHATLWALVAFAAGVWWAGALALGIRTLAGVVVGRGILGYRRVLTDFWMIPLRDLFGFAVWLGGLFGDEVLWRGRRLRLEGDGRIRA
jgi:ceramide glucosyltransferase